MRAPTSPSACFALALLVALGALLTPSPTAAQAAQDREGAEDAWLGVGLRQTVRCEARTDGRPERDPDGGAASCTRAFVAEAVVEDAPADRAGVQPGDTVVAVNGRALSRESGRDEFVGLESERPAQLLVGRPGEGRLSFRVVPEPRPDRVAPERVRVAAPSPPDGPALPRQAAGVADPSVAAGVGAPRRPGAPDVVLGRDEEGRAVVRWRDGDSAVSRRLREMTPRFEEIRDSVFAQARRHIRALREQQREAFRRARGAAARARDEAGAAGLLASGTLRAAGAEFRPLTAELADYFPGTERGLLIMDVVSGTPADDLGLRPGDVVVEAAGRRLTAPADLRDALEELSRRDSVVVKWVRKGSNETGVLRRP